MLLYTRLAAPKVPKKRSRAGCNYCKEKKKKCDEIRPHCARCQERGQDCVYEPVRPRQRRKRDSNSALAFDGDDAPLSPLTTDLPLGASRLGLKRERCGSSESFEHVEFADDEVYGSQGPPLSARSMDMHIGDSISWGSTADMAVISPVESGVFDFATLNDPVPNDDDDVEEITRRDSVVSNLSSQSSRNPSLALIAPVPVATPRLEFCAPAFAEFSERTNRRALVDHFCNVLSHLIVFREDGGNPFQQLVLPLSHSSPAVMDAIYALASAHLEFRGVQNGEKSVYFHNQAIQGLARLIQQGCDVNRNELLAAIMLLVYYEVLVQKARSNIVDGHLKGAMTIMSNGQTPTDRTGVFLERAFRFYDVIAALSFGTAPLSTAPGHGCLAPFPPLDSRGAISPLGSVDALLGMATSLWPIIHRMSNLRGLKVEIDNAVSRGELSKVAVLRTEFETTASATESALNSWKPILPPEAKLGEDADATQDKVFERGRLQSIINNALAYRHSALVYLYRTIFNHPRSHRLVQHHAHASLTHCIGTVNNDGPMGALLWPLFVAACEATDVGDRDLARQTFVAIDRRQGMTNIERAWCIVQEVWRRADEEERMHQDFAGHDMAVLTSVGGDLWRRVSEDMGVTIVFG
ncbi:transcriptional regulatory pro-1 [Paramyrothecium foliicola]|nr:transcriptional regulatory pro-1 [Paramyrothecium foliicola]